MLTALYNNLLALLLTMLAGAVLRKTNLITPSLRQGLNRLLYYFALPILVFNSMLHSITWELLQTSYYPLLFGAGLAVANGVIGFIIGAVCGIERRERRLFAFLNMFGNNLYLGLPIAQTLFGDAGVAVVLLYSLGSDLILWSVGQYLLADESKFSLSNLKAMLNPTLLALLAGTAAGMAGLVLPAPYKPR